MKRQALVTLVILIAGLWHSAEGQELLQNGDFETLATTGDPPMLTRDAFGNAIPIDWFRATEEHPTRLGVPLTELIGPDNGDPADDSDGNGQNSVAMNSTAQADHADWRSEAFATVPGEEVFWSFDFKFLNYTETGWPLPEGFRIELRSFDAMTPGGSTSGTFAGEQTVYVYVHGYGDDTNGDGLGDSGGFATGGSFPHSPASVTVMNFNDGQWHTLSSDDFGDQNGADDNNLWKIPSISGGNPGDGLFSDVRVSVNAFTVVNTDQLQIRIDNISVFRPIEGLPGDYNDNGTVDAADYVAWRNNLDQSVTLPNDETPGMVTQEDYIVWRANFGRTAVGSGLVSLSPTAVPEPHGLISCAFFLSVLTLIRRRMQRITRVPPSIRKSPYRGASQLGLT